MAAFMSNGPVLCRHEPSYRIRDIKDLPRLFDVPGYDRVGIAEHGLAAYLPWILDNIDVRVLIIERTVEEANASLRRIGIPDSNYCQILKETLDSLGNHPMVKRIQFEDMTHRLAFKYAFWHLVPGIPFDEDRLEEFDKLNIQVSIPKVLGLYERHRENVDGLWADMRSRTHLTGACHA